MSGNSSPIAKQGQVALAGEDAVAFQAAALMAIDPAGLSGAVLRGPADSRRDEWLDALRNMLPRGAPWRRVPLGITDGRLLGGLDLVASLSTGRPIAQQGLLAESDGGIVILPMAERVEGETIAKITAVLDQAALRVAREGITFSQQVSLGVIALDEGATEEEQVTEALSDRLAFRISCSNFDAKLARGHNLCSAWYAWRCQLRVKVTAGNSKG